MHLHLPTVVIQLLFAVQLVVCLYAGYRTALRTGRSRLNWMAFGTLAAIVFPPFGAAISLVAFLVCPPRGPRLGPTK